ncbi:MAG TPA: four helix bundle protein [Flavisolibacter sp.]
MQKDLFDRNPLLKLTLDFSLMIIQYCEKLEVEKKYVIARQLLKSGTSIGANSFEAQNAESKADFVHKIKIAAKEADETQYWLMLCSYSSSYPDCGALVNKLVEIQKIINKILGTAKQNSTGVTV